MPAASKIAAKASPHDCQVLTARSLTAPFLSALLLTALVLPMVSSLLSGPWLVRVCLLGCPARRKVAHSRRRGNRNEDGRIPHEKAERAFGKVAS
jgi:hypothetical protein